MSTIAFDPHIKRIFHPYVDAMLKVSIATPEGTFSLDLADYSSVCRMSQRIKIVIEGYMPGHMTGHPMPPPYAGGALPKKDIEDYNKWLDAGMPETADGEKYNGVIIPVA